MTEDAATLTDAQNSAKRWRRVVLRLCVPAVLLGFLWSLADGPEALGRLGHVGWGWLLAAFVAANLQTVLSALRWQLVARRLGLVIGFRHAVAEYYLAQLVNQSIPGGVVGDAARAVRSRHGADLGTAAKAVVIERMAGQIALLVVLSAGLAAAIALPGGMEMPFAPAQVMYAAGIAVVFALALWLASRSRIMGWVGSVGTAARQALVSRGALPVQSGLGLAIVAINLATFAFCALATGTVLGFEAIVVLIPLILSAMLVPATIAGWGFREGAAAALFPLAGASAAAGLAASIAFGLVILAASLPGLLFFAGVRRPAASSP